jgi:Fic family protein
MYKINVGEWRQDSTGPMQVISGAMGKEKVHFQSPDASKIENEMSVFIDWLNKEDKLEPVIKSGIAHLWFLTIHPFDDGNCRIALALTDMLLARSDGSSQRFYSMSDQIRLERKGYYGILETTQKGGINVTGWLQWFLNCMEKALLNTEVTLERVLVKANFWRMHSSTTLNDRQKLVLNKLMDNFEGKLTSSKWAKMTKCSADTALRDIQDLINKDLLRKKIAGGRSTNYELNM